MTKSRRSVQQAHERYQVGLLLRHLQRRYRASYEVVAEPNPPEAIISTGRTTRWVEVVTAYWNQAYAKDLHSHATAGEQHAPIGNGLFTNMTPEFAANFTKAVQAKLQKESYTSLLKEHGPGYLVVAIQFPFFGDDAFDWIDKEWNARPFQDRGCFRSIYLTYRHWNDYAVKQWRPPVSIRS